MNDEQKILGADAAAVESAGSIASDAASHAAPMYTPGPWAAFDSEIVSRHTDQHIADAPLEDGMNPTEWQANLHLIAAAPELYEALKELRDAEHLYVDDALPLITAREKADVALAKAEGRDRQPSSEGEASGSVPSAAPKDANASGRS